MNQEKNESGARRKFTRALLRSITVCIVLALSLEVSALTAGAVATPGVPGYGANDDGTNVFELDRNATDDGTGKDDDWANVLDGIGTNGDFDIIARTECESDCQTGWPGVLIDPAAKSIFVQGSKDILDIDSGWTCRDQVAPDKDELNEAYAVAYEVNGELIAYMGTARYANNGAATMGFWLLQADIVQPSCIPAGDGKFRNSAGNLVEHANGDLLVVADFTNGGAVGTIKIFEWLNGNLVLQFANTAPDCSAGTPGNVCGTINQNPTTSPWTYIPKGATGDSDFITYGFMEIGVNLSSLFSGTSEVPCFSTFLAETRSSNETSASQKDFVMGSFNVCSIGVTKVCGRNTPDTDASPVEFTYDVGGCFDNTGFGSVTTLGITDDPALDSGTLAFYDVPEDFSGCNDLGSLEAAVTGGAPSVASTAILAPGDRIIWLAKFTSTSNGPSDTVTATATGVGGAEIEPATASADCPDISINPNIDVTKNCSTYLEDQGNELVVRVNITGYVCNMGDVPLYNVTIVDSTSGGSPGADVPNPILNAGTLAKQTDVNNPDCSKFVGQTQQLNPSARYYDVTYTPGTIPTTPQGVPQQFNFVDDVTATGYPPALPVGASTTCETADGVVVCSDTANADCSLCPGPDELCDPCPPVP